MRHCVHIFALLCLAISLTSCGGNALDKAIKNALVQGDTTAARLDELVDLIEQHPEAYASLLLPDGHVDYTALDRHVNEIAATLRPPMHWDVAAHGAQDLHLTIYLERSGSMVPYDRPGGRGQLKKTVNDLINNFPGTRDHIAINIVNDDIYPYDGTIDAFLQDRDIYASTAGVGNAAYTDFGKIFERILATQAPDEVSILITDLIYSPADTRDVSIDKLLNEENSLATSVFKRHPGKGLIVYRMTGDYDGKYYPYNGHAVDYHGERPFFVLVMADATVIERMAGSADYAAMLHPAAMCNSYCYGRTPQSPQWAVVPDRTDNAGRWRVSHDDHTSLTAVEPDRVTGALRMTLAADLSPLDLDDALLCDSTAYVVTSLNGFTLSVRRITEADVTINNRAYTQGKTHLFTLTAPFTAPRDEVTIALPDGLPQWVTDCNTTSDLHPTPATTLGLETFMRGIQAAYGPTGNYFTIKLKLEK